MGDARSDAHFHLHQPLGGEGDHVAQNVRIGGLLHKPAKVHHLIGHWRFLGLRLRCATRAYRKTANDRRKPLTRYRAMKSALRERHAPPQLHHAPGHDPFRFLLKATDQFRELLCNGSQNIVGAGLVDFSCGPGQGKPPHHGCKHERGPVTAVISADKFQNSRLPRLRSVQSPPEKPPVMAGAGASPRLPKRTSDNPPRDYLCARQKDSVAGIPQATVRRNPAHSRKRRISWPLS